MARAYSTIVVLVFSDLSPKDTFQKNFDLLFLEVDPFLTLIFWTKTFFGLTFFWPKFYFGSNTIRPRFFWTWIVLPNIQLYTKSEYDMLLQRWQVLHMQYHWHVCTVCLTVGKNKLAKKMLQKPGKCPRLLTKILTMLYVVIFNLVLNLISCSFQFISDDICKFESIYRKPLLSLIYEHICVVLLWSACRRSALLTTAVWCCRVWCCRASCALCSL